MFSFSQSKILPRTCARLLSSLLHYNLIYSFQHQDYNHFNNFLLSITTIFHLYVNEFNRETKTSEKSYIKVKKWMSRCPIFLSVKEWVTHRYTLFIIVSLDSMTKIRFEKLQTAKERLTEPCNRAICDFSKLGEIPRLLESGNFFKTERMGKNKIN